MQSVKELRNLCKSKGIKVTYVKNGQRKYYTKKELKAKCGMRSDKSTHSVDGMDEKGGYGLGGAMRRHHRMRGGDVGETVGNIATMAQPIVDSIAPEAAPFLALAGPVASAIESLIPQSHMSYASATIPKSLIQQVAQLTPAEKQQYINMAGHSTPEELQAWLDSMTSSGGALRRKTHGRGHKKGGLIGLALPPQYQKKMTAGALHAKHQRVKQLLKKVEDRVMKPYLEKFYSQKH